MYYLYMALAVVPIVYKRIGKTVSCDFHQLILLSSLKMQNGFFRLPETIGIIRKCRLRRNWFCDRGGSGGWLMRHAVALQFRH